MADTDTPPGGWVRCPKCDNRLGLLTAGKFIIRHRGREWVGTVDAVRCERCGTVWTPTPPTAEAGEARPPGLSVGTH